MAAYIDREASVESLNAMKPFLRDRGQVQLLRRIMNHIGKIPAADVVPVVRCKDCKHYYRPLNWPEDYTKGECEIDLLDRRVHPDDYCSYGERKDGEG